MKFKEIDFIFFLFLQILSKILKPCLLIFCGFFGFFFFWYSLKAVWKATVLLKSTVWKQKKKKKSKIINNFSSFYRIRVKGFCFAFSRVQNHVIKRYFQRDRSLLCASVYVRMHTYQNLRRLWLCSREQQDTERLIFITTICLRSTSTDVHTTWNRSSKVTSKKWIWMIQNYGCINNLATA